MTPSSERRPASRLSASRGSGMLLWAGIAGFCGHAAAGEGEGGAAELLQALEEDAAMQEPAAAPAPTETLPEPVVELTPTIPVAADAVVPEPEPAAGKPAHRQIEEIVVTAQKREERLQDVPVSVAAFSGEELEERNAKTLEDIAVPNVEIKNDGLLNQFFVRGIGTNFQQPIERSIVTFVDDIAFGDRGAGLNSFLDVERVEFLRGPQGTLFGKNTVAGAISITTRKPQLDAWEGRFSAAYGSFNDLSLDGVVNLPLLSDRLALRLGVSYGARDGYVYNTRRNEYDGDKSEHSLSLRGLLRTFGDDRLEFGLRFNDYQQENGPPTEATRSTAAFATPSGVPDINTLADPRFDSELNHRSSKDRDEYMETSGVSSYLKYFAGLGDYNLVASLAYSDSDFEAAADADYSPIDLLSQYTSAPASSLQAELRLTSPPGLFGGRFEFISGLFGAIDDEDVVADINVANADGLLGNILNTLIPGLELPLDTGLGSAQQVYVRRDLSVTQLAPYVQGTLMLTERFDLILGARYSWIESHLNLLDLRFRSLGRDDIPSPFELLGGGEDIYVEDRKRVDASPTMKLSLRFRASDEAMFYATAAQGFKAGGYSPANPGPDFSGYEPEKSTLYEIGSKLALFDARMRLNATAFYTDYRNFQALVREQLVDVVKNAAQAETAGAELESQLVLPWGLNLAVSGAWLPVARFVRYPNGPCQSNEGNTPSTLEELTYGTSCDQSGTRLPYAPEWSAAIGLNGGWPLWSERLLLTAGIDANWSDELFFQPDGDPLDTREALWRFNARAGLLSLQGGWSLQFFVNNLSDETWSEYGNNPSIGIGNHYAYVSMPRTWTLRLGWSF